MTFLDVNPPFLHDIKEKVCSKVWRSGQGLCLGIGNPLAKSRDHCHGHASIFGKISFLYFPKLHTGYWQTLQVRQSPPWPRAASSARPIRSPVSTRGRIRSKTVKR